MSYSLKLDANGDLDTSSNVFGIVSGIDKLEQDMSIWLREEYSIDRFHPDYGSTFEAYIGGVIDDGLQADLQSEALRVLSQYQQIQLNDVQANPSKFSLDELLDTVISVECTISYDTVFINVTFSTASGIVTSTTGQVTIV